MSDLIDFYHSVMRLAYDADIMDEILWFPNKDGSFSPAVLCNDVFWWATSDMEIITSDNIGLLKECLEADPIQGNMLFCCRVRNMRPQGAMYQYIDEDKQHLYDACGPEREADFGNPMPRT